MEKFFRRSGSESMTFNKTYYNLKKTADIGINPAFSS